MSGQLRKPKFVRKLEFDAKNSEDDQNKLKSCKLVSRGRNNSTLPINLNTSFASLKNTSFSEENPFLSKKNQPPLTRQRDVFDVIPKSSNSDPKIKTIKNRRTSPKISSTSKARLKINRYNKKDVILLREKVEVTSSPNTLNSSKIDPDLYSPRSTSKFAVSDCLETNKSSNFGHSPSFKRQGNTSWKQTSVDSNDSNPEAINLPNSPCFVDSTQFEKKKEIFKRSKLKIVSEEKVIPKKIGINSEFLNGDTRNPELFFKMGKEGSKTELSSTILNKLAAKRFPRLSKTPEKCIFSPNIENQDFQNNLRFERSPEIKLVQRNVDKSPIVITGHRTLQKNRTGIKVTSPIIKSGDEKILRKHFEDGSEEMIIDSPLVKTNSIRSKRKNKITKILKDSKLKIQDKPASPLKSKGLTNENILSSPELIKSSPVVSKNSKFKFKNSSKSNKMMKILDGKNNDASLIIGISPNYSKITRLNPEVILTSHKKSNDTLNTSIITQSPKTDVCKSPAISLATPKFSENRESNSGISFCENLQISVQCHSHKTSSLKPQHSIYREKLNFSENSSDAPICKSPKISLVNYNNERYKDRNPKITSTKNSRKMSLCKYSLQPPKCSENGNSDENIIFVKNSPKLVLCQEPEMLSFIHTDSDYQRKKCNNSVSNSKSHESFLGNQKSLDNKDRNSDISLSENASNLSISNFPENYICKSPEMLLVKRNAFDNNQVQSVPLLSRNSRKKTLCQSPQTLRQNPSEMHENNHSALVQKDVPLIIGIPPTGDNNSSFSQNITEFNISPVLFPQKRKINETLSLGEVKRNILEPLEIASIISVSEDSLCKSPEIKSVKYNGLDNSYNKLSLCKSPEILSVKKISDSKYHTNLMTTPKISLLGIMSPGPTSTVCFSSKFCQENLPAPATCSSFVCKSPEISSIKKRCIQTGDSNISLVGNNLNEPHDDSTVNKNFINKENDSETCTKPSLIVGISPKSFISSKDKVQPFENPLKSPVCKSPEILSIKRRRTNVQDNNSLRNSCLKFSLRNLPENETPKRKNIGIEQEELNSSFINPNQSLIIGFSSKCFNSPIGNVKRKVQENSTASSFTKSPKMSSIKSSSRGRKIDANPPLIIGISPCRASLRNIKRTVEETQESFPQPSFCKSPEISSVKRKGFDLQHPTRSRKKVLEEETNLDNFTFLKHSFDTPPRKSHRISSKAKESGNNSKVAQDHNLKISKGENLLEPSSNFSNIPNSPISISSSPLINKIRSKRVRILFSSKEICSSPQQVEIESSSEKEAVLDEIFLKKRVAPITKIGLETQLIDEFYTETLHLAGTNTKSEGWSSEAAISEILSEEKSRQLKANGDSSSPQVPAIKPPKRKKLKSRDSASAQLDAARNALVSERRIREYERNKNGECSTDSKEFTVLEVWGTRPQKIQVITDEGEAILILGEGLVYSPNDVKPGCIIRIYPPWQTLLTPQGLTLYLSIRICDILPGGLAEDIDRFADVEEEISIEPYIEDPNRIMKILLNESDSDS